VGKDGGSAEGDGVGPPQGLGRRDSDAEDADASGFEPVWAGEDMVGFVTSGGYGHYTKKSLAMALINPEHAEPGTDLSVHVVGVARPAKVIPASPYDPAGQAMRG